MTKEEILLIECEEYGTSYEHGAYSRFIDGDVQAVYDAMDEYAKQQAIGFNQWIRGFENSTQAKKFFGLETDDQLYEKFSQSK